MGRLGTGVEVRGNSIRLAFAYEGEAHRHTLMLNGKPMRPTAPNVKHAHRLAVEIREKIRHGIFSLAEYFPEADTGASPAPLTVATQLDDWLASQRIEQSTRNAYQSAVNFWKKADVGKVRPLRCGDIALRALVTSHVLKALATRPDLSGKTLNNYKAVLREAIEMAVTDGVLKDNPVNKVRRASYQRKPVDPFTRGEGDRIVAHLASHYPEPVANMVEFWMWTGFRTSELFGLTWTNVDLARGSVLVSESVVQGVRKARTKTSVTRVVILNSRALAALERQRAHTQLAGGPVFQDPRYGTPWRDERAFRRSYWTPTLKLLGIRYHRPYNLRHTYATIMLMAGMTSAFCAKQLGHSIEMFHSTYAKWLDGEQNDLEMQRLEQAIVRIPPQNIPSGEVSATIASENREIGGVADGTRTHDNRNHNPGLYQLSYSHHCRTTLNQIAGMPGGNRTHNPQLRRLVLYPVELRAHS